MAVDEATLMDAGVGATTSRPFSIRDLAERIRQRNAELNALLPTVSNKTLEMVVTLRRNEPRLLDTRMVEALDVGATAQLPDDKRKLLESAATDWSGWAIDHLRAIDSVSKLARAEQRRAEALAS